MRILGPSSTNFTYFSIRLVFAATGIQGHFRKVWLEQAGLGQPGLYFRAVLVVQIRETVLAFFLRSIAPKQSSRVVAGSGISRNALSCPAGFQPDPTIQPFSFIL